MNYIRPGSLLVYYVPRERESKGHNLHQNDKNTSLRNIELGWGSSALPR
jgi:hypothetical protein